MEWLEITINTRHELLEPLTARLEGLGVEGLVTEDEEEVSGFLENNRKYWDYVDEDFMRSIAGVCRVKFYLTGDDEGRRELERLTKALPDTELLCRPVRDEDWENNWKQYYKPIALGERLMIVPKWEETPELSGRVPLRLDPGLIFGTGSHATTQMCLRAIESLAPGCPRVLDLGCGSGILAIAALLLGSESAVGVDIDDKAPAVVMENAALNGIGEDRLTVFAGDVLSDAALSRRLAGRRFDLVTANIVADVIIALAPRAAGFLRPGGAFLCSGIIEGRQDEVSAALEASGLEIREHFRQEDWHCFLCRLPAAEN